MRFTRESVMEKKCFKILWRLTPFLILLSGLLFPSCGFIGLLFDGGDEGDSTRYYEFKMSYNYFGGMIINSDNPLIFLFIPLDENNALTDNGFENAIWRHEFLNNGVVVIDQMKEGSYAVLGYIESNGIEGPNMYEVYAFYYMRDFVSSVHNPDYIWVDSSIEDWTPNFDLDDTYQMDGFAVISPRQNDTVHGVDGGYMHVVGLLFDKAIRTVEFIVDGTPQGRFNAGQESFLVNMSIYDTGPLVLDIIAYDQFDNPIPFDLFPFEIPLNFNYVAP
jgi:hypothetical protein